VNAVDLSFYMLAMNIISQTTILPLLITQLALQTGGGGISEFLAGFPAAQMFTAGYAEGLRRRPFIVLVSGVGEGCLT
jgi:hypothetical protein